jgi:glycerol uptake facilitator-like aquaporin
MPAPTHAAATIAAPAEPVAPSRGGLVGVVTAEAIGTALLVMAIIGSGIAADQAFPDSPGLALLVNAIATGAALAALIAAFGQVSAAFNPLVTLLASARRDLSTRQAAAAIGAQLTGAGIGVLAANTMFALPPLTLATTERADGPVLLGEFIATVGLLLVVVLTTRTRDPLRIGVAVGGYITAAMWFTSSTAFANPAVTLARIGTDTFTGINPASAATFLAAQTLALPAAYLLAHIITRSNP